MFTFVVVRGNPGRSHSNLVAAAWLAAAVAAVVCGAIAVIPCRLWVVLARSTGYLWAYTAAAALAAASALRTSLQIALTRPLLMGGPIDGILWTARVACASRGQR